MSTSARSPDPSDVRPSTDSTPSNAAAPPAATAAVTSEAAPLPALPRIFGQPPSATCPSPPAGFIAPNSRHYRGFHPTTSELRAASLAIADLGRLGNLTALLGPAAPSSTAVAAALDLALKWRAAREASSAWDAYVRAQDGMAWKDALTLVDQLKPLFHIAAARSRDVANRYPGIAELCDAANLVAKRSLATRQKRAKEKAAEAAQAEATAPAPAPAAHAPDPAVVQPTKLVTVTI